MKIRKAVVTAAGPSQRSLPLQTLIDRDGAEKPVLQFSSKKRCGRALRKSPSWFRLAMRFPTRAWRAIMPDACASSPNPNPWVMATPSCAPAISWAAILPPPGGRSFLYQPHGKGLRATVGGGGRNASLRRLGRASDARELFAALRRRRRTPHRGSQDLYRIDTVIEKPTPTEAGQRLVVPGLRAARIFAFSACMSLPLP